MTLAPKLRTIALSTALAISAVTLHQAGSSPAMAQEEYPSRPIEWIVMWSAGGGADTATRIFTKYLEKELGQDVVVKNVTGAGGTIGYLTAMQADADGYTLVSALSDLPKYVPLGNDSIKVDNFDILGGFAVEAPIIVAKADAEWDTPEDFVKIVEAEPGEHTIGVSNIGGVHHQPVVLWMDAAGIDASVIAHKGSPQMNAALLGGHTDLISSWVKQSLPNVQSGELKYVGYFGAERLDQFPDVPTFKELGYDIVWEHSYGMAAPKGVPEDRQQILQDAMAAVWANPAFAEELNKLGLRLHKRDGEEYRKELLETQESMGKVVEILNQ